MRLYKPTTVLLPTWQGWGLLFLISVTFLATFALSIHRFLAVTQRVANVDILVIEAWVPEVVLRAATREFFEGRYQYLIMSDVRPRETQNILPEQSRAKISLDMLASMGIPRDRMIECPASEANDHRSHSMAVSVRDALRQRGTAATGVNIIAPAAHARKTWLAYRRVLEPEVRVGIVSVATEDYDPANWWLTSQGAKWVITDSIGWLYEWVAGPRS